MDGKRVFAVKRGRSPEALEDLLTEGAAAGWDFVGATEGHDGETTLYFEGVEYSGSRKPDSSKPFGRDGVRTK